MKKMEKAYAITDVKATFVSLVDKAANKKSFLITKAEDGSANVSSVGKIIRKDDAQHHLTGVVYEPMAEDAHGEYMNADEIQKAAYWFAKNGDKVDLQHNFEECKSCTVVETWVAKADFEVDGEAVKKGTWLMTVEVSDDEIWGKVQKGEISGFSMGGVGKISTVDDDISKSDDPMHEKKSVLKQIGEWLGIEKGAMTDVYNRRKERQNLWLATEVLVDMLSPVYWDNDDARQYEIDGSELRDVLGEFNEIIVDLLQEKDIVKAVMETKPEKPLAKAGKKMSTKNVDMLKELTDKFNEFSKMFVEEQEEDEEMTEEQIKKMVSETVEKALAAKADPADPKETGVEDIQKMVDDAVAKALEPIEKAADPVPEKTTAEQIEEAVQKALEPILKNRGLPSNLNSEAQPLEKQADTHYLNGFL